MDPKDLRARIIRGPHRSTLFALQFDISPLMNDDGTPVERGEIMEEILFDWCRQGIRKALAEGRKKVKEHP